METKAFFSVVWRRCHFKRASQQPRWMESLRTSVHRHPAASFTLISTPPPPRGFRWNPSSCRMYFSLYPSSLASLGSPLAFFSASPLISPGLKRSTGEIESASVLQKHFVFGIDFGRNLPAVRWTQWSLDLTLSYCTWGEFLLSLSIFFFQLTRVLSNFRI